MRKLGKQTRNVRCFLYAFLLVSQKSEPEKRSNTKSASSEVNQSRLSESTSFSDFASEKMEEKVSPESFRKMILKYDQVGKEVLTVQVKELEDLLASDSFPAMLRPFLRFSIKRLRKEIRELEMNESELQEDLSSLQKAAEETAKTA